MAAASLHRRLVPLAAAGPEAARCHPAAPWELYRAWERRRLVGLRIGVEGGNFKFPPVSQSLPTFCCSPLPGTRHCCHQDLITPHSPAEDTSAFCSASVRKNPAPGCRPPGTSHNLVLVAILAQPAHSARMAVPLLVLLCHELSLVTVGSWQSHPIAQHVPFSSLLLHLSRPLCMRGHWTHTWRTATFPGFVSVYIPAANLLG